MKIILFNPPPHQMLVGNNPKLIDQERGKNPPLGLLYVASSIQRAGRHSVEVVDGFVENHTQESLVRFFAASDADVLGVTVTSFTLLDALEVIKAFRHAKPEGKVIAGGPHTAIFPVETIGLGVVDVAVKREGEPVINDILDHVNNPERLHEIKGICFRSGDEVVDTGQAEYVKDLDTLPPPDRALLPYTQYYSLLGADAYLTTLFTSRGCPFRCAFCDRPALGKRFRCHSAEYVIREIEQCLELGIKEFLVYDDTFTVNRRRVLDICRTIIDRKLNISWDIRARVDTVDEEMLFLLRRAGCTAVHYGVESGSERIIKRLNKGITPGAVRQAFGLTKKAGMRTLAYFMVGNPGEDREDIDETLELGLELDPDYVHITVFTPFPATQLYEEALRLSIVESDVWRAYAQNPSMEFTPPIWEENFSRAELQAIIRDAYKRFYLRPKYIWRRLTSLRSLSEFKRQFNAGLSVLRLEGL